MKPCLQGRYANIAQVLVCVMLFARGQQCIYHLYWLYLFYLGKTELETIGYDSMFS